MAKEDFCFTYYDGDAARDTTHMNRLERGAYHDIVISQRKFGHLSLDQVKKILGRDFVECWPAVELIVKVDAEGKFFIEWLEMSIKKMRAHSKKQSQNVTKRYQNSTKPIPNEQTVTPLEDGDGNGDGIVIENKKEREEKNDSRETPDFSRPDVEGDELIFPINTTPAKELWAHWKKYRWEKYQARYGFMGEQADLKRLEGMNFNQIQSTILAAISNGWKNLYPEQNRNQSNGTGNKKQQHTSNVAQYVAEHYGSKLSGSQGKPNG